MTSEIDKSKIIRDAATIILLRYDRNTPQVLMGQRGSKAAFMPSKYVFPGGAVDEADYAPSSIKLEQKEEKTLASQARAGAAQALCTAAIRELHEETGLTLPTNAHRLRFIFRAITPPGRPRRFDARFFLGDAAAIVENLDDFSKASDELSHLHWIDLNEAKSLDLPFITEVVLSEVLAILDSPDTQRAVPFFRHDSGRAHFSLLTG